MSRYLGLVQRLNLKKHAWLEASLQRGVWGHSHIDKHSKSCAALTAILYPSLFISKLVPRLLTHYIKRQAVSDDLVGTE